MAQTQDLFERGRKTAVREGEREGGREKRKLRGLREPSVRFAKIYVPGILRMDAPSARNSSVPLSLVLDAAAAYNVKTVSGRLRVHICRGHLSPSARDCKLFFDNKPYRTNFVSDCMDRLAVYRLRRGRVLLLLFGEFNLKVNVFSLATTLKFHFFLNLCRGYPVQRTCQTQQIFVS